MIIQIIDNTIIENIQIEAPLEEVVNIIDESINEIVNVIISQVGDKGDPGLSGVDGIVFNETPSGLLNGSNATFTTAQNFVPGSVEVFMNGMKQQIGNDFNTSGNTTIILTFSPSPVETISVNYLKL